MPNPFRVPLKRLLIIAFFLASAPVQAAPILLRPDPLNTAWLSVPDGTKTQMRSGYDYNDGNYDSGNLVRIEPAGITFSNVNSTWVLFDAEGPGVITSIWFTGKNRQGQAYLGGRLEFFFDGETNASLSGDLPALFESGTVFPPPLAERSSGGWIGYAPIYFAKSLKIALVKHLDSYAHRQNGRGEIIPHLYHQFTYQQFSQPVKTTRPADLQRMRPWPRDERGTHESREVMLPPGERVTAFSARGRGILNLLRFTLAGVEPDQARLCVTADGRTRIDLSVSEFWGFSRPIRPAARLHSLLLDVGDSNAVFTSHWPMPHRDELRVEIENRGPSGRVAVETLHLPYWPEPEHFYFHAAKVTDKTERERDIHLLQVSGRGHFVGTILALADKTLEGDDRFFVDDEAFPPSWHGTGTEDYFRCGWYFHGGPTTRPLYGLLDNARPKVAYRFHVADRVNFNRAARIGFEHGHQNDYLGPYSGVVFWYAEK